MKAFHEVRFPSQEEVENGTDAWGLLPPVCNEDFYGKRVRVTVETLDEDPLLDAISDVLEDRDR